MASLQLTPVRRASVKAEGKLSSDPPLPTRALAPGHGMDTAKGWQLANVKVAKGSH